MAQCPADALADAKLPAAARVVLTVLWSHAGRETRFVWPSRETLAQAAGVSERSLRRHLSDLKARGWVVEGIGTNGRPGWSLCDPPGVVAHTSEPEPDAAIPGQAPATPDRPELATRPKLTAEPATPGRAFPMEPTKNTLSQSASPTPPRSKLAVVPDARRERDHALAQFHELARWHIQPPKGCGTFVSPPSYVYDLLDQGQTPEDIAGVLRKAAERINAGHIEARMWGAPLLKGWYVPIRDEQPIGGKGAKPTGPKLETAAEAEAYAKANGNSLTGTGWGWELDGRGGQRAVRIGGAA